MFLICIKYILYIALYYYKTIYNLRNCFDRNLLTLVTNVYILYYLKFYIFKKYWLVHKSCWTYNWIILNLLGYLYDLFSKDKESKNNMFQELVNTLTELARLRTENWLKYCLNFQKHQEKITKTFKEIRIVRKHYLHVERISMKIQEVHILE